MNRDRADFRLFEDDFGEFDLEPPSAPSVVQLPPPVTVTQLPAFSGMLRDRDPLALASWATRPEFAGVLARMGWSGPTTYETGEFTYEDVGESGQTVATPILAARPEWVQFVRTNALEVMLRDLGWMAADVFLVANGGVVAQFSDRPSDFDRTMGTIVDIAAPMIITAGISAAVAPVVAAAELPAVVSQVATRAATSTVYAAATDRPIDVGSILESAVIGQARSEVLGLIGSILTPATPVFVPLDELEGAEPVFDPTPIVVPPIEVEPLDFGPSIEAEILAPPPAIVLEPEPVLELPVFEPPPPVLELPVFEPPPPVLEVPVFEPPPPVLEVPVFEPPPEPIYEPPPQPEIVPPPIPVIDFEPPSIDPDELYAGYTDPGGKNAFGRLDIEQLEKLGATREEIIEVAQEFYEQDLPVGPAAQRWIETGSFDPPPIASQEVPAMDYYDFEPPAEYFDPYEPPAAADFYYTPPEVYGSADVMVEPPAVSFGGEDRLPTDLPPYEYGAPAAPDAPIPSIPYTPPAPTSRDWSVDQVITTVTRAADQAIKLVRAWETRKLPPNMVARATDAQGRTVLAKGDGMIYTRTPQGTVSASRPAVGLPQTTVDGFVVVNNGDGTFTRITPSGARETLRYPAAAPGGAGAGAGVGLLVVAGIAAFALMG